MSSLLMPNGDDHPDAAHKHLLDAKVLLDQLRPDGAGYLSGYVVECALKSLLIFETGQPHAGHHFATLMSQVSAVTAAAGARSAKYFGAAATGLPASTIMNWAPGIRYQPPSMTHGEAQAWYSCARDVFQETIHQMKLDGVI